MIGGVTRGTGLCSLEVLTLAGLPHFVVLRLVVLDDGVGDGVQDLSHLVQAAAVGRGSG